SRVLVLSRQYRCLRRIQHGRVVDRVDGDIDGVGVAGGGAGAGRHHGADLVGDRNGDAGAAVVIGSRGVAGGGQRGVDGGQGAVEGHGGVGGAIAAVEGQPAQRAERQRAVGGGQRDRVLAA